MHEAVAMMLARVFHSTGKWRAALNSGLEGQSLARAWTSSVLQHTTQRLERSSFLGGMF